MLGEDEADAALDMLGDLAFVEATSEGLALHDAVHTAIVERLARWTPNASARTALRLGITCSPSPALPAAATSPDRPPICCS